MTEEQLANLAERKQEAEARAQELESRPSVLYRELEDAERAGAVGEADKIEAELSVLIGPARAARTRASILGAIHNDALKDLERAAAQQAAEDNYRAAQAARYAADDVASIRQREEHEFEAVLRDVGALSQRLRAVVPLGSPLDSAMAKLSQMIHQDAAHSLIREEYRRIRDAVEQLEFRKQATSAKAAG